MQKSVDCTPPSPNACLAGGNTIVISTRETNKNVTVKFLKKHMAYVNFTSLFFRCAQ